MNSELIIGYVTDSKNLETIATIYTSKCSNGSLVYVLRVNNKSMYAKSAFTDIRFRHNGCLKLHVNRLARANQIDSVRYITVFS